MTEKRFDEIAEATEKNCREFGSSEGAYDPNYAMMFIAADAGSYRMICQIAAGTGLFKEMIRYIMEYSDTLAADVLQVTEDYLENKRNI